MNINKNHKYEVNYGLNNQWTTTTSTMESTNSPKQLTITSLQSNSQYQVRVRFFISNNVISDWSSTKTETTGEYFHDQCFVLMVVKYLSRLNQMINEID